MSVFAGASLDGLQRAIEEHYNPGQRCSVVLGLERELTDDEVGVLESELAQSGLRAKVEPGMAPEWPAAVRLEFTRPAKVQGVGVWPLAAVLVAALGAVGIVGILGWRLGEVVAALAKNLLPIALIGAATFLMYGFVTRRGER